MTDEELQRLGREALLQLIHQQRTRLEKLEKENEELRRKLEDRVLVMEKAGSIAEAALRLNGVFEATQRAADQYLQSIWALGLREQKREEQI